MPPSPETPQVDVTEVLHGEAIPDPYRWLEDGDAPETRLWTEQQNAVTEAYPPAAGGGGLCWPWGCLACRRRGRSATSPSAGTAGRISRCSTGGKVSAGPTGWP